MGLNLPELQADGYWEGVKISNRNLLLEEETYRLAALNGCLRREPLITEKC